MNARLAAERLHHLSMRYSGAVLELVTKSKVGFIAKDHPGLRECRDLIDLILLTRAEINGLTRVLVEAKIIDAARIEAIFAEEYEWFTQKKAHFLGVGVTDFGIVFQNPNEPGSN